MQLTLEKTLTGVELTETLMSTNNSEEVSFFLQEMIKHFLSIHDEYVNNFYDEIHAIQHVHENSRVSRMLRNEKEAEMYADLMETQHSINRDLNREY